MEIHAITGMIIRESMNVHSALGPGLLESSYEACLCYKSKMPGMAVEQQKAIPLIYEEVKLACGYRADLVVNEHVIVEIKSVEALHDLHYAQLITYLKLSNLKVGLLINFNVRSLKNGIKRLVNNY